MINIRSLEDKAIAGQSIARADVTALADAPLEELCAAADRIRKHFCGNAFDLCAIVNGKSGRCGEDCKFCAQSAHYGGGAEQYALLPTDAIVRAAEQSARAGALRFSVVTSGRQLSDAEVQSLCETVRAVRRRVPVSVCVSAGLLREQQFCALRAAGVERAHCNLETCERFFARVCTTHTYADKIEAITAARNAGLTVCSGGIMGLGESMADRIDLAFSLRALGVRSVPVNFLQPIAGTPLGNVRPLSLEERRRTVALFRFILPDAAIRLAGGRKDMPDKGAACFTSGANACITGDMLTTEGVGATADAALLQTLGYTVQAHG